MRKLPKPEYDAKEVFLECISNTKERLVKEKLELCADEIETSIIEYEKKKINNQVHTIPSADNVAGIISSEDMSKLYNNKMVNRKGPGRKYYDKLITLPKNSICPLCAHREVSTLDHYLPKKKYPSLSVALINLIPACKDCNFIKCEKEFTTEANATIHPYYDEIDDVIWLNAKLNEEDNFVFIFEVLKPKEWDALLYERVKNHFKLFNLNQLYSVQAAVEFEGIKTMLINIYNCSGEEILKKHLRECLESYESVNINTWKCCMYRALIASDWFYTNWLVRNKQ